MNCCDFRQPIEEESEGEDTLDSEMRESAVTGIVSDPIRDV